MAEIKQNRKPLIFRIYEWPLSYFVGLLIGLVVVVLVHWTSDLRTHFQPTGIILFLGGWVILMGAAFPGALEGIKLGFDIAPPTKLQKWIRRVSLVVGIALSAIACTFFTLDSNKSCQENNSQNKTLHSTASSYGVRFEICSTKLKL